MSALEAQNLISALMCEDQPDSDVELFGDENSDYDTDVSDVDSDILNSHSETPVQVAAGASKIQYFSVADLMSESDSDSNQTSSQVAVSSAASVTQGGSTADISSSDSASDNQATAPGRPTQNPLLDSWKQISEADSDTNVYAFNFAKNSGIQIGVCNDKWEAVGIDPNGTLTPYDFFQLVWDENVVDELVSMVNEYGGRKKQMNMPSRRRSLFAKWTDISAAEMMKFLAVTIQMGIDKRPSVKKYWSVKEQYHTPWFNSVFARERFELLYHSMLHAAPVSAEKTQKILPFLKKLVQNFQEVFYPFRNVSIDEMVVGFKGRVKYIQYNPTKPSKFHLKIFGLCDSSTAYVYNLLPYFGSQTVYTLQDEKASQAKKVFYDLLSVLDDGHHVFSDRYYTSLDVSKYLAEEKNMYFTGTLNTNRKGLPKEVKKMKMKHLERKFFRDEQGAGPHIVVAWRDKKASKPVVALSTFHNNETVQKQRRFGHTVTMPKLIADYYDNMNGCDRADQAIGYYCNFDRKSYKWWKKLFWWILEVAQYNAFVLYNLHQGSGEKRLTLLQFKEALIQAITNEAAESSEEPILKRKRAGRPADTPVLTRLKDTKHLVTAVEKQRECRVCSFAVQNKRKRTSYVCFSCPEKPHLCPKDCFLKYHTMTKCRK